MTVQGPFFRTAAAAVYCGFSERHFRDLLKKYIIPRTGPGRKVFARSVLDAFMSDPESFRAMRSKGKTGRLVLEDGQVRAA